MDCQTSDSKRLLKVFDAAKCRKSRRKRDDDITVDTDGSASVPLSHTGSAETSIQQKFHKHHDHAGPSNRPWPGLTRAVRVTRAQRAMASGPFTTQAARSRNGLRPASRHCAASATPAPPADRESSPDRSDSPVTVHRRSRSPRKHRRTTNRRDGISLALKASQDASPRPVSPCCDADAAKNVPQDQDSFIYTLLTEAIEKDKMQRQSRKNEEHRFERERSEVRAHRHHRRRRNEPAQEPKMTETPAPLCEMNQAMLLETFAKLCSQMKERTSQPMADAARTLSHKSLQCEVETKHDHHDRYMSPRPERIRSRERSRENQLTPPPRVRSQGHMSIAGQSRVALNYNEEKCSHCYEKEKYYSKIDVRRPTQRYQDYADITPTRSRIEAREQACCRDRYDYRVYDGRECLTPRDNYDVDKRRFESKTSRSFDISREPYVDEDRRMTARSDKDRRYDERDKRFYDRELRSKCFDNERGYAFIKDRRRSKRNLDANFDRASIVSREDDYYRERDCASVADDASSITVSGKGNYLRTVKQEILEQREAMDKMMKLWRELMRCFKSVSQNQSPTENKNIQETAENARDSANAQLRLWQECMRRYETVARDVGDTDARLMEEINKQRSEMAEMASMWQECLQRYREMSTDFRTLKQKVDSKTVPQPECPSRIIPPLICAEGEGTASAAAYRFPPNYPQPQQPLAYMDRPAANGSPLRPRASAPPAWWWGGERGISPRRRSSPESRGSRDRGRHRHRDRDDSRYKEKSSKPSVARSEHRHRKR